MAVAWLSDRVTKGAHLQFGCTVKSQPPPSPSTEPDRVFTGPPGALEAFCLEFDYLSRSFQRLGVRESDVEDLAHEAYLVLSRKWPHYDPSRPLRPYLFGIALRISAVYRRQQAREVPGDIPDVADTRAQPDQALASAQARAVVLKALESIALPRRAVFVMHDLDETPMRVTAKMLNLPLFTAYSRLRKARQEFERAIALLEKGSP